MSSNSNEMSSSYTEMPSDCTEMSSNSTISSSNSNISAYLGFTTLTHLTTTSTFWIPTITAAKQQAIEGRLNSVAGHLDHEFKAQGHKTDNQWAPLSDGTTLLTTKSTFWIPDIIPENQLSIDARLRQVAGWFFHEFVAQGCETSVEWRTWDPVQRTMLDGIVQRLRGDFDVSRDVGQQEVGPRDTGPGPGDGATDDRAAEEVAPDVNSQEISPTDGNPDTNNADQALNVLAIQEFDREVDYDDVTRELWELPGVVDVSRTGENLVRVTAWDETLEEQHVLLFERHDGEWRVPNNESQAIEAVEAVEAQEQEFDHDYFIRKMWEHPDVVNVVRTEDGCIRTTIRTPLEHYTLETRPDGHMWRVDHPLPPPAPETDEDHQASDDNGNFSLAAAEESLDALWMLSLSLDDDLQAQFQVQPPLTEDNQSPSPSNAISSGFWRLKPGDEMDIRELSPDDKHHWHFAIDAIRAFRRHPNFGNAHKAHQLKTYLSHAYRAGGYEGPRIRVRRNGNAVLKWTRNEDGSSPSVSGTPLPATISEGLRNPVDTIAAILGREVAADQKKIEGGDDDDTSTLLLAGNTMQELHELDRDYKREEWLNDHRCRVTSVRDDGCKRSVEIRFERLGEGDYGEKEEMYMAWEDSEGHFEAGYGYEPEELRWDVDDKDGDQEGTTEGVEQEPTDEEVEQPDLRHYPA